MNVSTLLVLLTLFPLPAVAQSTLSLDDFDLGPDPAPVEGKTAPLAAPRQAASDMETCLLDPSACENDEFRSGTSFSLDDVVNLGIVDREEVAATRPAQDGTVAKVTSAPLPSIDVEILFDYNSADLRPDQITKIAELSRVIGQEKFKNYRFLLLGHTDAKGSASYNLALSQRRAQTVATFVGASAGLQAQRIIATGMGASKLKAATDPYGAQNRRVQLVLVPVN
ncbi:OmpA family protein [Roseibium sp. AS2]|uniref:OmpA family protein n=1 Tax=Roseibium sp. AS2 TaxID=3135781 RepID=UPI00317C0E37